MKIVKGSSSTSLRLNGSGAVKFVAAADSDFITIEFAGEDHDAMPVSSSTNFAANPSGVLTFDNDAGFNAYIRTNGSNTSLDEIEDAAIAAGQMVVDGEIYTFQDTGNPPTGGAGNASRPEGAAFIQIRHGGELQNVSPVAITFAVAATDSTWTFANATPSSDVAGTTEEYEGSTPTARWLTPSGSTVGDSIDVELMAMTLATKVDTRSIDDTTPHYPDGIDRIEILAAPDKRFTYESQIADEAAFLAQGDAYIVDTQTLSRSDSITGIRYYSYKQTIDTSSWAEASMHEIRACIYPNQGTPVVLQGSESGTLPFDRTRLDHEDPAGFTATHDVFNVGYHSLYLFKKSAVVTVDLSSETFDRTRLRSIMDSAEYARGVEIVLENNSGSTINVDLNDGSVAGGDFGVILTESFPASAGTLDGNFTTIRASGSDKIVLRQTELASTLPQIQNVNWKFQGFEFDAKSVLRYRGTTKYWYSDCEFPRRWFWYPASETNPMERREDAKDWIKANLNTGATPSAQNLQDLRWMVSTVGYDATDSYGGTTAWVSADLSSSDSTQYWRSGNNVQQNKPISGLTINLDDLPQATDWHDAAISDWTRKPDGSNYVDQDDVDTFWDDPDNWDPSDYIDATMTSIAQDGTGYGFMDRCDIDGGFSPVKKLVTSIDVRVRNHGNDSFAGCNCVVACHTAGTGQTRNFQHPWDTYHNDTFQSQNINLINTIYAYLRTAQDSTDVGGYEDNQLFQMRAANGVMLRNHAIFASFFSTSQGSSKAATGNWDTWLGRDVVVRDCTFIGAGVYPDYVAEISPTQMNRALNLQRDAMDTAYLKWSSNGFRKFDITGIPISDSNTGAAIFNQSLWGEVFGATSSAEFFGDQTQVIGSEEYYGRHNAWINCLISASTIRGFDRNSRWWSSNEWDTFISTFSLKFTDYSSWVVDVKQAVSYLQAEVQDTNWPSDFYDRDLETGTYWQNVAVNNGGWIWMGNLCGYKDKDVVMVGGSVAKAAGQVFTTAFDPVVDASTAIKKAFNTTATIDYDDGWAVADITDGGNGRSDLAGRGCPDSATLNVAPGQLFFKEKFDASGNLITNGTVYDASSPYTWDRDPTTFPWHDFCGEEGFLPVLDAP